MKEYYEGSCRLQDIPLLIEQSRRGKCDIEIKFSSDPIKFGVFSDCHLSFLWNVVNWLSIDEDSEKSEENSRGRK
jgi:hypothetical protein